MTDLTALKALKSQADVLAKGLGDLIAAATSAGPGPVDPGPVDSGPVDPGPVTPPPTTPPVVGGAVAKDVSEIDAQLKAGKTSVFVRKGALGALLLTGLALPAAATIQPEDPSEPAVFSRILGSKSSNIAVDGFKVVPTIGMQKPVGAQKPKAPQFLVDLDPTCSGMVLRGLTIMGRDDAMDCMNWLLADWAAWAWSGIDLDGTRNLAVSNKIFGVNFGLRTLGIDNGFFANKLLGLSADGVRPNGDKCVVRGNRITDFVLIDENHPDAIQPFGKFNSANKTYAPLDGSIIEDNDLIEWTVNPNNPLRAKMQGIGVHNGLFKNASIRRNRIRTSSYTGIKVNNGENVAVEDNYTGNVDNVKMDCGRIEIHGTGTVLRNQAPKYVNMPGLDPSNKVAPF